MSFIDKIKTFFCKIFKNNKALPEAKSNIDIKDNFSTSFSNLVNINKIDTELLIEKIKSREYNIQDKSIDEIKEIQVQLKEYLNKITKENNQLEGEIKKYKQKLISVNNV